MTECALPQPVMLTMSPTSSNTILAPPNNLFARRSSIRRGTISSISKDIRVNDFVEIIKRQKAIQQKERAVIEAENALLKRRHSMLNMSNKTTMRQPPAPNSTMKSLRSRTRTMSNTDLKATHFANVSQQKQKEAKLPSPKQQQMNATDRIRLEAADQHNNTLYQHLRKCSACCINREEEPTSPITVEEYSSSNSDLSTEEEDEGEEENHLSPSTSTSSTHQQMRRPFLNPKNTCSATSLLWQKSEKEVERENVIKDLNSSILSFSNQIKQLMEIKSSSSSYYDSDDDCEQPDYKHKIQECKALVAQQQKLLAQLEETIVVNKNEKPLLLPPPPTHQNRRKSALDICQEVYKSWTLPKSATTQVTIKQKADKNEADTIISVQGVCTTIESSLIPDRILSPSNSNDTITTFRPVYQFKYKIDITHEDRLTKFKLMDSKQWQSDDAAHSCSFKHCRQEFNWFQRKHHCRGCGQVYCNTHSVNRLPLFKSEKVQQPIFSRVCDTCFYQLAGVDSLEAL